jgi:anti-sigma-K factor RskA
MSDIHALSGAYAVDALDDAERRLFEEHLASCPECRAEVASFRETTASVAVAQEEPAPDSLRAGVLAAIAQVRPLPPETPQVPVGRVVSLRRRALPMLVAAAVALVLVTAGAFAWHPWRSGSGSGQTTVADQVLHASDAVRVTERLPGGAGDLVLVRSASVGRAVMVGTGVPEPPAGKTYQLWLQQPGSKTMVSAGLMPDSHQPTLLTGDALTATAAAVSVEPATGSRHPTTDPVAVFPLTPAATGTDGA